MLRRRLASKAQGRCQGTVLHVQRLYRNPTADEADRIAEALFRLLGAASPRPGGVSQPGGEPTRPGGQTGAEEGGAVGRRPPSPKRN